MVRFIFLLFLAITAQSEGFKESDMKNLFELEQQLILNFQNYAKELQQKYRIIKSALTEYSEQVKAASLNPELYLSNPFNTFRTIRRLSQDWNKWQLKMEEHSGLAEIKMQQRLLALTPKKNALQKTAERLQYIFEFYNYEPGSFLQDNSRHLRLSSADCCYIGQLFFEQQKYHEAEVWLKVATENNTASLHNDFLSAPNWQIYELKFQVYLRLNKFEEAQLALASAMRLNATKEQLSQQQQQLQVLRGNQAKDPIATPAVMLSKLQQQCGGSARQDNTLSCDIISTVTPFLLLAPLRSEDLCYEPYVMLYREGIYDKEILHVKQAYSKCPATHKFVENGGISGCLIPESYSPLIGQLSTRMLDMTGLDAGMDGLFVLEYGSINAFKPLQLPYLNTLDLPNIEATAILFLNDVALGGALTIPNLDVVVFPQRGNALVTFNDGNFEHTLCPNVVGNSMVMVKFLFTKSEELEEVEDEYI